MATKSGASHSLAVLATFVFGSIFDQLLQVNASKLHDLLASVGDTLLGSVGVDLPASTVGTVIVGLPVAFLWGVAYHYTRR